MTSAETLRVIFPYATVIKRLRRIYRLPSLPTFFSKKVKFETNNQGMSSVTFSKPSTGIPVPFLVSHKKVPFRLLFLENLCITIGTNSYSDPWTTLEGSLFSCFTLFILTQNFHHSNLNDLFVYIFSQFLKLHMGH